jgi:hypothetical protein
MPDIFDLVNAEAIGEYVTTMEASEAPLLGATLFPAKKIMGLDLKFIKGFKSNAVALRPSALGARAFVRDRIGGAAIQHEIPFFREKMVISERLRQELARAKVDATDPYTASVIEQIFDDAKTLTDGANVQAERQRMQLLFNGQINIKAPAKDGGQPYFDYNYDESGDWATSNVTELLSTAKWSDHENSNPVDDILELVDKAANLGVTLTRAICSPKTFRDIMANVNVKNMFRNADQSLRVFSRAQLIAEIATITGVTIAVYNKSFIDEDGATKFYAPDNKMVFLPDGALGATVYGTTPEEIDLMSGYGNATTSIVNTGVAITTSKSYGPPVTVETVVSELVIPSFERMAEVFVISY